MRLIKPAYTLFLKTSNSCQLGCRTCPAGRKEPDEKETGGMMRPEMLDRILNRIKEQGCRVINIAYHYYNESLLIPWINELVEVGSVKHGINGTLSSNLSKGVKWETVAAVVPKLRNLIISVSGWNQDTYDISHKGGDVEQVKHYMQAIAKLKAGDCLKYPYVRVSWHRYRYNQHEEPLMRRFCEQLGFHFTPYDTGLLPLERVLSRWRDGVPDPGERDLFTKMPEAKKLCRERRNWACIHQDRMITVDGHGDVHGCCVKLHDANRGYGPGKPSSIFEIDLEHFNRWRKKEDSRCKACKAIGLHVYAMQQYRRPNTLKVSLAKGLENAWRRSCLGGVFPGLSALWTDWAYSRPEHRRGSTWTNVET